MFISLSSACFENFSNGMPFLFFVFFYHILQPLRHEVGLCVDSQMIHFELFYHLLRMQPVQPPNNIYLVQAAEKKYILGIHPKRIIIPAPFHSKAFVLLYKFETSWALLGRLSSAFFWAISEASNFKHFKELFMTLSGLGLLTM